MAKKKKSTTDKLPVVELITVLDRSGSMSNIADEAIGMYNTYIKEQMAIPGDILLTTVLFDDKYEILYNGIDIKDAPELDNKTFVPRGMTALYDAVGKTINTVSERLEKMKTKDKPGKLIMVILTDGEENNSKEFKGNQVRDMISKKQSENWDFVYLASDLSGLNDQAFSSVMPHFKNSTISTDGAYMGTKRQFASDSVASSRYIFYNSVKNDELVEDNI